MRIDALGEFGLIARLTGNLETRPDVVLGVGDDAAALELTPDAQDLLVATCDTQVAGRHFLLGVATPEEIGHKSLAVNLSDIAAMGAQPLWALVSLVLPPDLELAVLDGIYAGMRQLARRFDVALVGGNVAATEGPLVVDVTLLGRLARTQVLRRSGGQAANVVAVTGTLGAAAAGVLTELAPPPAGALAIPAGLLARARRAQTVPEPQVAAGQALAAVGGVTAMLDVSDGLLQDLGHLCDASGVGAALDVTALPVDPAAEAVARAYGRDPLDLALGGGEDYQLLFAVEADRAASALAAVAEAGGSAHVIGQLTLEPGLRLREPDGRLREVAPEGWDHLRR